MKLLFGLAVLRVRELSFFYFSSRGKIVERVAVASKSTIAIALLVNMPAGAVNLQFHEFFEKIVFKAHNCGCTFLR